MLKIADLEQCACVFFSAATLTARLEKSNYGNHLGHPTSFAFHALFTRIRLVHQAIAQSSEKDPGNLGVRVRKTKGLAFWTLAMWRNNQAIRTFVPASPHKEAMQKLPHWCDEAAFVDWEQDTADWQSWETATEKLAGTVELTCCIHLSNRGPARSKLLSRL